MNNNQVIDEKNTNMTVYKYKNKTIPMNKMRSEEKLSALISLLTRAEKAGRELNQAVEQKAKAEKQIEIQDSRIITFNELMDNLRFFLERDDNIIVDDSMTVDELSQMRQQILQQWEESSTV